jgi:hypothetical protein
MNRKKDEETIQTSMLQQRLNVMIGKWIARAEQLATEAEEMGNSERAYALTSVINSKNTIARMYRTCATEVAKEAGLPLPK